MLTLSRDVRWLASASDDESVGLWALAGNQPPTLRQLRCDSRLFSVAFSSDGQLLAMGDDMGYVFLWEPFTDDGFNRFAKIEVSFQFEVRSVCFSPDDSEIAAASNSHNIYVWNFKTNSLLHELEGHEDYVRAVIYSADGERLASGSDDHTIRLWNASTGQAIVVLRGHIAIVRSVAFMPDGKSLVSGAEDGTIRSWNVDDAVAPPSQANLPPVDILAQARQVDGWLAGFSEERLIWLPQEYRPNIVVGRERTSLIASHQVVISADTALHHGTEWTKCWSESKMSTAAGSS